MTEAGSSSSDSERKPSLKRKSFLRSAVVPLSRWAELCREARLESVPALCRELFEDPEFSLRLRLSNPQAWQRLNHRSAPLAEVSKLSKKDQLFLLTLLSRMACRPTPYSLNGAFGWIELSKVSRSSLMEVRSRVSGGIDEGILYGTPSIQGGLEAKADSLTWRLSPSIELFGDYAQVSTDLNPGSRGALYEIGTELAEVLLRASATPSSHLSGRRWKSLLRRKGSLSWDESNALFNKAVQAKILVPGENPKEASRLIPESLRRYKRLRSDSPGIRLDAGLVSRMNQALDALGPSLSESAAPTQVLPLEGQSLPLSWAERLDRLHDQVSRAFAVRASECFQGNLQDWARKFEARYDTRTVPLLRALRAIPWKEIRADYQSARTAAFDQDFSLLCGDWIPDPSQRKVRLPQGAWERLAELSSRHFPESPSTGPRLQGGSVLYEPVHECGEDRLVIRSIRGGPSTRLIHRSLGDPEIREEWLRLAKAELKRTQAFWGGREPCELLYSLGSEAAALTRGSDLGIRGIEVNSSSARARGNIPLRDLGIRLQKGALELIEMPTGKTLEPLVFSAVNVFAPRASVTSFLSALSFRRSFDGALWPWGNWASLRHLPRMESGNFILSPERWLFTRESWDRLCANPGGPAGALRKSHGLPREVVFLDGDRRIPLDLESELASSLLQHWSRDRKDRVILQESFLSSASTIECGGERFVFDVVHLKPQSFDGPMPASPESHGLPRSPHSSLRPLSLQDGFYEVTIEVEPELCAAVLRLLSRWKGDSRSRKFYFLHVHSVARELRLRFPGIRAEKDLASLESVLSGLFEAGTIHGFRHSVFLPELEVYGGERGAREMMRFSVLQTELFLKPVLRLSLEPQARAELERLRIGLSYGRTVFRELGYEREEAIRMLQNRIRASHEPKIRLSRKELRELSASSRETRELEKAHRALFRRVRHLPEFKERKEAWVSRLLHLGLNRLMHPGRSKFERDVLTLIRATYFS